MCVARVALACFTPGTLRGPIPASEALPDVVQYKVPVCKKQ